MKPLISMALATLCTASASATSALNNESRRYVLEPLPSVAGEAARMDRMELSAEQPAGLFLRKGQRLTVSTTGLTSGHLLAVRVGFPVMFSDNNRPQVTTLTSRARTIVANQDGPVSFSYTGPNDSIAQVSVAVTGGSPLPLYIRGQMTTQGWKQELKRNRAAPFVTLVSDRSMITLRMRTYRQHPIPNPDATFATVNQVIGWEEQLAGFDGSSAANTPTRLRVNYVEDIYSTKADQQKFYMYATSGMIGMLASNTQDLTNPKLLSNLWGIWHETGHTEQQNSWTWGSLTEINVNMFSLYVQEQFQRPSRLGTSEEAGGPTTLQLAKEYLARGPSDYTKDDPDYNSFFVKLVMFHQLKEAYGWESFTRLHQAVRANPRPTDATDQDKVDTFVVGMCQATGDDLRAFFLKWGLRPSALANASIQAAGLSAPKRDPATIF